MTLDEHEQAAIKRLIEGVRRRESDSPVGCAVLLLTLGMAVVLLWFR